MLSFVDKAGTDKIGQGHPGDLCHEVNATC